jgi:hypothetical protein
MSHIRPTSTTFTDFDLQWFRGGIRVTDVINLVTEDDIVSDVLIIPTPPQPTLPVVSRSDDYYNGADCGFFDDSHLHGGCEWDEPTLDLTLDDTIPF